VLYSGSPFPAFINQQPTTQLVVATQNVVFIGDYDLQIKVTESISGLNNDENSFVLSILEPIYADSLVLVEGTSITDFTYTINENQVQVSVPLFTPLPADADLHYVYSLHASCPSFVTLSDQSNALPNLLIESSSNSDLGTYDIIIVITETFSGVTASSNFELTVACVTQISNASTIQATTYYVRDNAVDVTIPPFTISPATCPDQLEFSATLSYGTPLPDSIVLQNESGSYFLHVEETNPLS
jgi:hypothetical protein